MEMLTYAPTPPHHPQSGSLPPAPSCSRLVHHSTLHPVCPVMSCITCSAVGMSCVRGLYSIFVLWVQRKALCVSLRLTQLKRCAPSEADEERASLERSMWMPGRQRNAVVWLCALMRRHASNCASTSVRLRCRGLDFKEVCCWAGCELN